MTYLFWAFGAVWIGLFAYLFALMRRSRVLEAELRRLDAQGGGAAPRAQG